MADKIRLLPEVVANQIAAGEVVNRPASVVKEMMENAIDAGATSVKVNFRDGGKDLIQIVDDGCGMSPIDARMAFDRHATSKIGAVEDIYALHTFGFRGEALASIAAVSQVELRTRQAGDEVGTQTEINGGQFAAQNPVMCPVGSQFFVRNLFYNVPARRRFLDKSTTSASQIKAEFQRIALCNPQIAFELYANDAPVYTLQAGSLAGRIVDVVGRHIKQNLLEVEADTSIACIEGYIGRPAAAKKRNTEQYLFVNGRFFKSTYLTSAILKAYEKLIPESCQPSYFLYLTLDPGRIDVNVHPQKTEVKFADEEAVWQIVNAAVRETLAKTGAVPLMDFDRDSPVEIPVLQKGAVYSEPLAMSNSDYNPFREEYIDPSAPDPNEDFTGFDVPYRDGGVVSDSAVGGLRTGGVWLFLGLDAVNSATVQQMLVEPLQVQRGQVCQRNAADLRLDVVFQKALRGFEGGRPEFYFCVVFHPDLQPCSHRVGLGPPVVDAHIFLDGFLQLFLDFCLCLTEDIFDDGLASFWIVTDSVSTLPSAVLSFSDISLAVCSSFRHGISLLCNGTQYRKQQRKATG